MPEQVKAGVGSVHTHLARGVGGGEGEQVPQQPCHCSFGHMREFALVVLFPQGVLPTMFFLASSLRFTGTQPGIKVQCSQAVNLKFAET